MRWLALTAWRSLAGASMSRIVPLSCGAATAQRSRSSPREGRALAEALDCEREADPQLFEQQVHRRVSQLRLGAFEQVHDCAVVGTQPAPRDADALRIALRRFQPTQQPARRAPQP